VIKSHAKENPQAKRLMTIPGVEFILTYLFLSEIRDINRFPSEEKLSSYCALVPSVRQSGGFIQRGDLVKTGNTLLRWGFIEAAGSAIRFNPELKYWADRIKAKKGAGVAICAVAPKLVHIVYQVLTQKRDYQPRKIRTHRSSRPVSNLVAK